MTAQTEKAEHTPGPWRTNGSAIEDTARMTTRIATLNIEPDEWGGNARLIAAAPALYEALRKIAWEPIGDAEATDSEVMRGMESIARAALRLVEGE